MWHNGRRRWVLLNCLPWLITPTLLLDVDCYNLNSKEIFYGEVYLSAG